MRILPLALLLSGCGFLTSSSGSDKSGDSGGTNSNPFGDSDTDSDSDSDTDSDSDSDSDSDADADADSDSDSDSDADCDTSGSAGVDGDGDGYDDERSGGDDCDDSDADVNPGEPEDCSNRVDDDCDGKTDSSDSSCGSTGTGDTGIAYLFHIGEGATEECGEVWSGGTYGAGWYGVREADFVCNVIGDWEDAGGKVTSGCPDCEWVFNLEVSNSLEDGGSACDDLRAAGLTDGSFDDPDSYFNTSWGFTNAFDFYGDGSIIVEESLLFDYEGTWYAFAFNAASYSIQMVGGDQYSFSFYRSWAADTAGNQFYYYYYL